LRDALPEPSFAYVQSVLLNQDCVATCSNVVLHTRIDGRF